MSNYIVTIAQHSEAPARKLDKFFATFVNNDEGLRYLHGLTGRHAVVVLAAAMNKFANYRDFNCDAALTREFDSCSGYATWEDGFRFLARFLEVCLAHPRHIIHIYE